MKNKLLLLLLTALAVGLNTLHAQNTIVTYQGRVSTNGAAFTGSGRFKFALVTSTEASVPATATAAM